MKTSAYRTPLIPTPELSVGLPRLDKKLNLFIQHKDGQAEELQVMGANLGLMMGTCITRFAAFEVTDPDDNLRTILARYDGEARLDGNSFLVDMAKLNANALVREYRAGAEFALSRAAESQQRQESPAGSQEGAASEP